MAHDITNEGMPWLVVLRGTSATGKTTLAAALQRAMGRGTANIGEDHFRRTVLREHDVPGGANITLIEHTVEQCLTLGWHVIVEGILYEPHYGEMLRDLVRRRADRVLVAWLELPLEATLRRHAQRPLAAEVPVEKLVEWYHPRDLLGVDDELVLDATRSVDELVTDLMVRIGSLPPRPDPTGARFL